jgi:hypothetical protein
VTNEDDALEPGDEDTGLEPFEHYPPHQGINSAMKAILDVLYEAGEPLDFDTIAERTYEEVSGAARYHAQRRHLRDIARNRAYDTRTGRFPARGKASTTRGGSLRASWRWYIVKLVTDGARYGTLVRSGEHGQRRFTPNHLKAPRVMLEDGSLIPYTREAWAALGKRDQVIGEVETMRMMLDQALAGVSSEEIDAAFAAGLKRLASGKSKTLRWLIGRPESAEAKAWLLRELVRRAYGG